LAQNGPQPAGAGPGGPGRGPAQPAWKRPGAHAADLGVKQRVNTRGICGPGCCRSR